MKIFLLVPFLTLLLSSPAKPARVNVSKTFTCTLTVARTQYKLGELPELKVEIANNTDKNVYLLGSLDGSSVKGRMPYCYFTIIKSIADTIALGRCGNMNTLRLKDFVLIKSGEKFDPYQEIDSYGFFNDPWVQSPETFKKKGNL